VTFNLQYAALAAGVYTTQAGATINGLDATTHQGLKNFAFIFNTVTNWDRFFLTYKQHSTFQKKGESLTFHYHL